MQLGSEKKVFLKPASFDFLARIIDLKENEVQSKDKKKTYKQMLICLESKQNGRLTISDWDCLPTDVNVGDLVSVSCTSEKEKIQIVKIETI